MQIWIHDSKMKKIVALNNNIPDMLSYSNSTWHPYLDQATSTFDFTIPKFVNGELHEDIKLINDECFVSFYVNGSYQVFYIATLQEDDFNIQLTCNNTNLEYALEYANPFSSDSAQTIEWYLNHMDLLAFAAVEIGINEISDRKRTLTFDSQETKATRLQSLMSNFDAEFEFKVELNRDGTYKRIAINIYQKADETHHGIGSIRNDVVLYYSNGLKGVQVNSDKTQMFNAGVFIGKDGLSLNDVEISVKNSDGVEEYYSRKGNPCLYAPIAMRRYPATMRSEGQDNWIRKDFTTEYENINDLKAYALRTLKQYAYPLMTYTASVQSDFVSQYTDLKLGDTIRIIDKNFAGGLALEARVSEMIISFDNPANNSFVFTNYRRISNKPTSALQSRIDKAVESKLPYRIELATTNGVTFKNSVGETIVKPSLFRGNSPYTSDVTWRWALDGNVTVGMQYLVKASSINDTAVLTVSAYVGNNEVATTEITLTNVNDGADGAKGDKGETGNGIANTVITYGLSTSETTEPATWASNMPVLVKGMYLWTRTVQIYTNGKSTTSYQKGYIAKDGNDGLPGEPGADGKTQYTHIAYADNATGGGFSLTDNTKPYWGMYQDFNATNSNDPTKYKWSKWKGDQGLPGKSGADGKTPYIHFAYADDDKGTNLSFTDKNQQYQGYYSDYTEANSTDYKKYTWVDRLANVQVGGRNLIRNSTGNLGSLEYWERGSVSTVTVIKPDLEGVSSGFNIKADLSKITSRTFFDNISFPKEDASQKTYVISGYFKNNKTVATEIQFWIRGSSGGESFAANITFNLPADGKWHYFTATGKGNKTVTDFKFYPRLQLALSSGQNHDFDACKIKAEYGNVPTDWTPAPEDTQDQIDSKADSALTQEQLNALAEQDNLIKAEMEAKASIDTVDKWITAYENYVKANDADKAKSEQALKEASERIVQMKYEVNDLKLVWEAIDRFMSFQNEGLVIGKKDGSAYAKFSDDRISLFSGSSEVMYISQGTLNIANGIFTKTIQIGRFRFETHPADADMLVLRYLGG